MHGKRAVNLKHQQSELPKWHENAKKNQTSVTLFDQGGKIHACTIHRRCAWHVYSWQVCLQGQPPAKRNPLGEFLHQIETSELARGVVGTSFSLGTIPPRCIVGFTGVQ